MISEGSRDTEDWSNDAENRINNFFFNDQTITKKTVFIL